MMASRDSYTEEEWQLLQFAPLWTFSAVAGVDKKIDEKEREAFAKELAEGHLYKEQLVREVMTSLNEALGGLLVKYGEDTRTIDVGLSDVADLLDQKADAEEANNFKKSMISVGIEVAKASGGLFGNKMSEEENSALAVVAVKLRANL